LFAECNTSELHVVNLLEIIDTDMEPERKATPPQYTQLKAILCTTSTKQLHNAYYKNYTQLTICVQAANLSDCRIESNRIEIFLARIGML